MKLSRNVFFFFFSITLREANKKARHLISKKMEVARATATFFDFYFYFYIAWNFK